MGDGQGDFNAFEKQELGWLTGFVQPAGNGRHQIGPIEGPTTLPQALVVSTALSEYLVRVPRPPDPLVPRRPRATRGHGRRRRAR